jgi:hypothetical protein
MSWALWILWVLVVLILAVVIFWAWQACGCTIVADPYLIYTPTRAGSPQTCPIPINSNDTRWHDLTSARIDANTSWRKCVLTERRGSPGTAVMGRAV